MAISAKIFLPVNKYGSEKFERIRSKTKERSFDRKMNKNQIDLIRTEDPLLWALVLHEFSNC